MSTAFFFRTVIGCGGEIVEVMQGVRTGGGVTPSIYVSEALISDPQQLDTL